MNDIASREDIALLIQTFYDKLLIDPLIGFIFTDVAHIDLATHLPKLYDFWEVQLLGTGNYLGNPMNVHLQLHAKQPLTKAHFDRWLQLFDTTVDALFQGPKAHLAKERALSIATVMRIRTVAGH